MRLMIVIAVTMIVGIIVTIMTVQITIINFTGVIFLRLFTVLDI